MLWLSCTGLVYSAVLTLGLTLYAVDCLHSDRFFRTVMCLTGACLSLSSHIYLLAQFGL